MTAIKWFLPATITVSLALASCGATPSIADRTPPAAPAAAPSALPSQVANQLAPAPSAAPPPPPPVPPPSKTSSGKIKVEIDSAFRIITSLSGDDAIKRCRPLNGTGGDDAVLEFSGVKPLSGPTTSLSVAQADDPKAKVIYSLLLNSTYLACSRSPDSDQFDWRVAVEKPTMQDTSYAPDPVFTPGLEWLGFSPVWGSGLQNLLGNPKTCTYLADGVNPNPKGPACSFSESATNPGRYELAVGSQMPAGGKIEIAFEKGKKVRLGIASCVFKRTGPLTVVVPGAVRQMIFLSTSPACGQQLVPSDPGKRAPIASGNEIAEGINASGTAKVVSLTADGKSLSGSAVLSPDSAEISINVNGVDSTLSEGLRDFELHDASDRVLGKVKLFVTRPITVNDKLTVRYADDALNALHSGESADRTAVIDPVAFNVNDGPHVLNTVTLDVPPELPSETLDALLYPDNKPRPDLRRIDQLSAPSPIHARCQTTETFWTATSPNAGSGTQATIVGGHFYDHLGANDLVVRSIKRIEYHIHSDHGGELNSRLKLWGAVHGRCYNADTHWYGGVPLLELNATVAKRTRRESLPLPIQDLLTIHCADGRHVDFARNGGLKAIDEGVIANGGCTAIIDYTKLLKSRGAEQDGDAQERSKVEDRLNLYGPQSLVLTVHREGMTDGRVTWIINANGTKIPQEIACAEGKNKASDAGEANMLRKASCACSEDKPGWIHDPQRCAMEHILSHSAESITLPAPVGTPSSESPYLVEIKVAARKKDGVVYRSGIDSTLGNDDIPTRPDLAFSARLNSRGVFGWHASIRTFLTISTEFTGIRFPARPSDLSSSRDTAKVQVISPRVGFLIGIEPWDYNTSKNPTAVGVRFYPVGIHILNFGDSQPVAVSVLTGLGVTLPLIEKPTQLGSSLAVAAYWEYDLRERFVDGNHLLLTVGANLGTLFGGK